MCNYVKGLHNIRTDKHAVAKGKILIIECIVDDVNKLPETCLGERVRKLRLSKKLNVKELSKLSSLSENTISAIEKSCNETYSVPYITTLNKLCQALDTTIEYLLDTKAWPEKTSGEIIYKYRTQMGLSQRELGSKCNLHPSTIKDYEDGRLGNQETLEIIYRNLNYKFPSYI